jgi:hypothetical protein
LENFWQQLVAKFSHRLCENFSRNQREKFTQVEVVDPNLRRHQLVFHHLPHPVLGVREKSSPPLGLLTRNVDPADVLRVVPEAGLDGFVFGRTKFGSSWQSGTVREIYIHHV